MSQESVMSNVFFFDYVLLLCFELQSLPKLHKKHIADCCSYTTTKLSKSLRPCLAAVKNHVTEHYEKVYVKK